MRKTANFGFPFQLRKTFLCAALLLLVLAVACTFLRKPIEMKTAAAPALEAKALATPTATPIAQASPATQPTPYYVWKTVREKPAPTPKPNKPPEVSLAVKNVIKGADDLMRESDNTICAGDRVALNAAASDPDGDKLLYSWNTTGGRLLGEGATVVFDATGMAPGEYTVTVQVDDGRGCVNFDSKSLQITGCRQALLRPIQPNEFTFTGLLAENRFNQNQTITAFFSKGMTDARVWESAAFSHASAAVLDAQVAGAPKCARLVMAAYPSIPRRQRVLVQPAAAAKPQPVPSPTPEPPSQYREKVTASYPERLEVDAPGKVRVQFGSEFVPIAPSPTPTLEVVNGQAKSTAYPKLAGRRAEMPLAAEMGERYTAWIKTELTEAQSGGLEFAPQSAEWQELKRGKDETLTWEWLVTARLPVVGAALVARVEIEWRSAEGNVRKVILPRFELPIKVADPLLNQEQLKTVTPLCYASSVGLFGVALIPGKRRREDGTEEDDDQPEVIAVRTGPALSEADDLVQCSVFAPLTAQRENTIGVQVFAHLQEQAEEAARLAEELAGNAEDAKRRAVKTLAARIARGTELMFDLQMAGLEVLDSVQTLIWTGQPESVQFAVTVPADCRLGNVAGKLTVSYNSVPVGHITFMLKIVDQAAAAPSVVKQTVGTEAHSYKMVFVSYASKDRDQVLRRVQMLDGLGLNYFQDVLSLDPGDRWEQKLYENIDRSDLFLLFWSSNAQQSEWVLREVQHALALKQKNNNLPEIKPVIIEGPPIVTPPPELANLHFNDKLLYFMDRPSTPQ